MLYGLLLFFAVFKEGRVVQTTLPSLLKTRGCYFFFAAAFFFGAAFFAAAFFGAAFFATAFFFGAAFFGVAIVFSYKFGGVVCFAIVSYMKKNA
ncbi:MAG: hypothetical protein NTX06_09800 [Proteobacteria bacterium]|nr:hypothetical protein [Pseudomonadota bacterium]